VEAVIDDWVECLQGLPAWAIQKSCQWWICSKNDMHRSKPLPGDIEGLARKELGVIRVAEIAVERFAKGKAPLRLVEERI
jgi:hypothetical protein